MKAKDKEGYNALVLGCGAKREKQLHSRCAHWVPCNENEQSGMLLQLPLPDLGSFSAAQAVSALVLRVCFRSHQPMYATRT